MAPSNIIIEKSDGEREQIEDVAQISQQDERAITKWESIKGNPKTLLWIGWTVFVLCLQGFDNQAGGIVVGIEEFRKDFGSPYAGDYVLPANWQSAFSGGPTATAVFGALFSSWLSDKISPLPLRGVTTAMSNLSLSIGPLICTILGAQYADLNTRWAYRGIFVAQWGFAAIALIFNPFAPESPWWLVGKGRLDEARKSLQGLGMSPVEAEKHLTYIEYTNMKAKEETEASSFTECFRGTNTRRTILTIMPLAIQAMSGVSFIATYSTYYFELAGNSVNTSFKLSCGGQGLSVAGNIISWFLVDNIGRRPLIFYGMCSLTALLMITGGLGTSANPGALTGTVAFIILYNFVFNIVIGAVAYTIISEIPTNKLRSKTISISLAVQQTLYTIQLFVLPYIFNPDKANLGAKTAFIFAGFSVLSCVYLWFCHPETANRSFREIDELFFNKVEARRFKSYVTTSRMGGTGMEKDEENS